MVRQGKILGHIISHNEISIDVKKINLIVDLPRSINPKGVQIFIDHCMYYRRFIYMCAKIAKPFYVQLIVLEWMDDYEVSYEKLK